MASGKVLSQGIVSLFLPAQFVIPMILMLAIPLYMMVFSPGTTPGLSIIENVSLQTVPSIKIIQNIGGYAMRTAEFKRFLFHFVVLGVFMALVLPPAAGDESDGVAALFLRDPNRFNGLEVTGRIDATDIPNLPEWQYRIRYAGTTKPEEASGPQTTSDWISPGEVSGRYGKLSLDIQAESGPIESTVVHFPRSDGTPLAQAAEIPLDSLLAGREIGNRTYATFKEVVWDGDDLWFQVSVNFLGGSGHTGIDQQREEQMGEDFDRDDPITVGWFGLETLPDMVDRAPVSLDRVAKLSPLARSISIPDLAE